MKNVSLQSLRAKSLYCIVFAASIFQHLFAQDCNLQRVQKGKKYGYQDAAGNLKIEANFFSAYDFSHGLAAVSEKIKGEEKYGFIDCNGKYVIAPVYRSAYAFDENGFAAVGGYKNSTDIYGKPAIANVDGMINKNGDTIIPFNFLSIIRLWNTYEARHGAFRENASLYDKQGKLIGTYENVIKFKDNSIVVVQNGKYGILDGEGNTILPPIAEKINMLYKADNEYMSSEWDLFTDKGEAVYYMNGKQGMVARNGEIVVNPLADDAFEFISSTAYKGTIRAKKNGKWGFMDTTLTREIIPLIYDDADNFYSSYAAVKLNGKYGFIDVNQKTILPFQYDHAYSFYSDGTASVVLNGVKMTIDENGNWIDKPAPPPAKRNCLQSCTDCGGTGTRIVRESSGCPQCGGTGVQGHWWNPHLGGGRWEPKACWRCNGTGGGDVSSYFEYCKTCNQTGCLKFE